MIFQLHNHFKPSSEEKKKIALYFEVVFGFIEVTDDSWWWKSQISNTTKVKV